MILSARAAAFSKAAVTAVVGILTTKSTPYTDPSQTGFGHLLTFIAELYHETGSMGHAFSPTRDTGLSTPFLELSVSGFLMFFHDFWWFSFHGRSRLEMVVHAVFTVFHASFTVGMDFGAPKNA